MEKRIRKFFRNKLTFQNLLIVLLFLFSLFLNTYKQNELMLCEPMIKELQYNNMFLIETEQEVKSNNNY